MRGTNLSKKRALKHVLNQYCEPLQYHVYAKTAFFRNGSRAAESGLRGKDELGVGQIASWREQRRGRSLPAVQSA